jgi:hypothetical protein
VCLKNSVECSPEANYTDRAPILQLLKKFPAFYETWKFITVITRALHWSLPWVRSIESIPPHRISLRSILILFTHLRLGLPSGSFSFSHQYPIYFPLLPHSWYWQNAFNICVQLGCWHTDWIDRVKSNRVWLNNDATQKTFNFIRLKSYSVTEIIR